jgi:hypothetical protein
MTEEEARALDRGGCAICSSRASGGGPSDERDRITPDARLVTKLLDELDVAVRAGTREVLLRASPPLDVADLREMIAPLMG